MARDREEKGFVEETAKWDYITLDDFHPRSSWTPVAYVWLWFLALIGVAVFVADTFTAVNLLAFDKWSSKVQPAIPLKYSRWIFAAGIIVSYVLYAYEWQRAIRVIRRGAVADSYLDPLAVQLQSMRGKGFKRFLVFTELTKSRKGADYVALFTYFQFKHAVRIIFAEAGRQVINAITLYSVMQADLLPTGDHASSDGNSSIVQFFENIQELYQEDKEQAIVLGTMLFTLTIFVFSAISLLAAILCHITFLWHYIPQEHGRLSIYCRRKIDKRLQKVVEAKVKAALEAQEYQIKKAEAKEAKMSEKANRPAVPAKRPTLPNIGSFPDDEKNTFELVRQDTAATLPIYSPIGDEMRPPPPVGLTRKPTLPDVGLAEERPGMPNRSFTQASVMSSYSYASNAPLLSNADDMGFNEGRSVTPPQIVPPIRTMTSSSYRPPPVRSATQSSFGSQRSYGPPPGMRPPTRTNTGFSFDTERNPMSRAGSAMDGPFPPPRRANTADTFQTIQERPSMELSRHNTGSTSHTASNEYTIQPLKRLVSRASFTRPFQVQDHPTSVISRNPTTTSISGGPQRQQGPTPPSKTYIAYNPGLTRAPTAPPPNSFHLAPLKRSATDPPMPGAYDDLLDEY